MKPLIYPLLSLLLITSATADDGSKSPVPAGANTEKEKTYSEKKKTARNSSRFDPAEVSPEELNSYIASLEAELEKLNSLPVVGADDSESPTESATLMSNAQVALQNASPQSLQAEFNRRGTTMTEARAQTYLQKLLETIYTRK